MSDLLTTLQIACIVLLALGAPAYAVLRLYWRAEATAYALRNERLTSSRLERAVEQLRQAFAAAQHLNQAPERRDADPLSHPPTVDATGRSPPT